MVVGEVTPGETVRVKRLCGGRRQQGRLCSMGVFPNAKFKVLDACEHGSCRILVRGASMTLCVKMQRNIEVELIKDPLLKIDDLKIEEMETVKV